MTRPVRTLVLGLLGAAALWLVLVAIAREAPAAPPPPDPAPPLTYTAKQATRALNDWALAVIDSTALDGVSFRLRARKCDQPRPNRFRCVVAGDWIDDDGGAEHVTFRLDRGRASRRVGVQSRSSTRARVVVKWRGDQAGGIVFRLRTYGTAR